MAAEGIGVSVAAEIIASLITKAAHQARYLFCFNNIVETLGKEKQQLIKTQQSIEDRAKRAHGKTETIGDEVREWLKDAENLITEVDKLQEETTIHSAGCGWCPNCIQRYRLGRRLAKKTEELTQVKGNCNFSEFARLATLRGMEYYSSEGFISFESRKRAYDQIMEALKDDGIRRIGVHSMGGSGKTTLVKEVGKEAEKLRLFEKVLTVVVSNHPDIRKIQASIAGSLGIKFELEENEPERARRLSMALSNRGKILVILDDVWEMLDFEVIGIPQGCHVLLTTRSSSVCSTMECQKVIPLSVLDGGESWSLFLKHAGITDDNFDTFKDVGKEIANECKGLPVAIAAVASSLKGKELVEWEEARDTLRDSRPMDIEPGLPDPYKCLQLSYDNLRSRDVKSLFLLCSFFPEDYEIPTEYLIRVAIGLGLFGKVDSNKRARNQVSAAKNKLVNSCLLLKGDEENCIKMHDLVRDVALWIARTENKMIIGEERSKKELQEHSILKESPIRYLWCKVDEFLDQLHCPKLEYLVINTDLGNGVEVPNESFNGIKGLRVLVLKNKGRETPILQMSKPIQSLTNLCNLMLHGWQLGDISFVCSLKTIEALTLLNCSFQELPDGVANLKYLRLLELRNCKIEKNPCGVIERSSQLEELYFVGNTWEDKYENNLECFGKNSDTSVFKLQRYHIEIGGSFKDADDVDYSNTRYLSVEYFDICSSYATIDDLMRRAESLCLGGIRTGCKSIIPDLVQKIGGSVNELTELIVHDSDEVECVVGITNSFHQIGTVFSNLTHLEISGMKSLQNFFLGRPHHGLFEKLEGLYISNCYELRHIIANEVEEIVSDGHNPRSPLFPKLKKLFIKNCEQLEYLMPVSYARGLLQLEMLVIDFASQMKYVFGQSNHEAEDLLCNQNENEFHIVKLQALKSLKLMYLLNIISICPESYYPIWPSLDSLEFSKCPQLNIMLAGLEFRQQDHTITKEQGAAIVSCVQNLKSLSVYDNSEIDGLFDLQGLPMDGQQVTAGLIYLNLYCLPELKYIWKAHKHFLCHQNLQSLSIDRCGKLKVIFSTSILRSLNQLKKLEINMCKELQQIIEEDEENKNSSNPHSGQVCLPQLTSLYVEECNKLKCLFPFTTSIELPKLTFLIIKEASELEEVIACEKGDTKEQVQVKFPKLEHLILVKLPNLREGYKGSELETVRNRVVHDCPKLSLMSSATLENLKQKYENYEADGELNLSRWRIRNILEEMLESGKEIQDENCISRTASSTSSNDSEITARPSPSLMDEQPLSGTSLMDRQERIKETVEASDQEGPKSDKIGIAPLSTDLEPKNPSPGPLVLLQNPSPQSIKGSVEEVPILDDAKIVTSTYLKGTSPVPGLSQVNTNQSMQGNEAQNDQNDNCIKSEEFLKPEQKVSTIASPNLTKSIKEPAKKFVGAVLDLKIPVIATSTNVSEFPKRLYPSHFAIPLHTTPSVEFVEEQSLSGTSSMDQQEGIKETVEESDQEDPKSEKTVIAPLSIDVEPSNKGSVEEGPTFGNVNIVTSSLLPRLLQQNEIEFLNLNKATSTSFNWLKEKEDHCEGLGKDSKNKYHQENFDSLSELSTSMPEAQFLAMQSEDKSFHWGKFITLSLFSGPQIVEPDTNSNIKETTIEESTPEKTTYLQIVPEDLHSEVAIFEETEKESVEKSPVSARSEVKTSSIELVQKASTSEPLMMTEVVYNLKEPANGSVSKASPSKKFHDFTTSSELLFSAEVPPPISTPAPTSQYFSCIPSAEGDISSGFDLNKPMETIFNWPNDQDSNTEIHLDNFNYRIRLSGEASPELSASVPEAQNFYVPAPVVISSAPFGPLATLSDAPLSSISLPPAGTPPHEVDRFTSSTGQCVISSVEEYAAFRDIGGIRKKHIALLEQAIENHPSLWAWHEKFKHPQMKQFGYTMLGNMLEFLASTKWKDLTQEKKVEFESLVHGLDTFGFDIQWLGNIHAAIKESKLNKESINQLKTLEIQVAVQEMELQKTKLELDSLRAELGNFNDFIGF